MIRRCKERQWAGLPPEQRDWMCQQSEMGRPTFINLGHTQHAIWSVEWYSKYGLAQVMTARNHLLCVKVDLYPNEVDLKL